MDLPSNIFCQYSHCNSIFIVHHKASDILEACSNPHPSNKKAHKKEAFKSSEPSFLNDNQHDSAEDLLLPHHHHHHHSNEDSGNAMYDSMGTNTSCCTPIGNKLKHNSKDLNKTNEDTHKNYGHKRIMVHPVILPCSHGFCQECVLTNLTDMICPVCSRPFTFRDTKVNKFVEQICTWFGENRTFISLLLGQDITKPPDSSMRIKLTRSVSSDITRSRSFISPLTRSSSTDSIGSLADEADDLTADYHDEAPLSNSTRLTKLNIELRSKPDAPPAPASPTRSRGFSNILPTKSKTPSTEQNGSTKLATSPPSSGTNFFRKIRASKKESASSNALVRPSTSLDLPIKTELQVVDKHKRESAPVLSSEKPLGVIGMHKRYPSAVHSNQLVEKMTIANKPKSKSFTTPKDSLLSLNVKPSSPTSAHSPPPNPFPSTPTGTSTPTSSSAPIHTPFTKSSSLPYSKVTPNGSPLSPTPSKMAVAASAFAVQGAGGLISPPTPQVSMRDRETNRLSIIANGHVRQSSPSTPSTPTASERRPQEYPISPSTPRESNTRVSNLVHGYARPSSADSPASPSLPASANSPSPRFPPPPLLTKLASKSNVLCTTFPNNMHEQSLMESGNVNSINTVPNSAYARPIKFSTPNSTPPPNLSRIFNSPLARKIEFRENRRLSPMPLNRRADFFVAPLYFPPISELPELTIAKYLPSEALEMGVKLAGKDVRCNMRIASSKSLPLLPRRIPIDQLTNMPAASSSRSLKDKRRSLPNIPIPSHDPTWQPNENDQKGKGSSLELIQHDESVRTGSYPAPSQRGSPTPMDMPSPVNKPHGKIGSIFMFKFKSFSASSDDLKRELTAEEALRLQGRGQTTADVNRIVKHMGVEMDKELLNWTTKNEAYKRYKWSGEDVEPIGPPIVRKPQWSIEYRGLVPWGKLNFDIEDKQKDVCWYTDHFFNKPHNIMLAGTLQNPLFIAVDTDGSPYKVLVRSKNSDDRLCLLECSRKHICKVLELDYESTRYIKDPGIQRDMVQWDMGEVSKNFKFGILYCKAGQTTEEEIFANTGSGSVAYNKFLACIGDKVPLKGWGKFAGGLDVDSDYDGSYSVFSKYKQYEIMFHVSTFLSHDPNDHQQLAKKKHIGNDIIVLVFMEPDAPPLDPTFMRTQFTQVYVLVQPVYPEGCPIDSPKYRISVAAKEGVRPFGPSVPLNLDDKTLDFECDHLLKMFLLLKLINAERAALSSPVFRERLMSARLRFLQSLLSSTAK